MDKNSQPHELPVEVLQECFDADFAAGHLTWKRRPRDHFATEGGWKTFNGCFAGKGAIATPKEYGCESAITYCGEKYRVSRSRVIWAMRHGKWPSQDIGHRNGNSLDDRIENLRQQTASQRTQFGLRRRPTATGLRGVYPTRNGKFSAAIDIEQRQKHLGTFDTAEEASATYTAEALRTRGEFARVTGSQGQDTGAAS